MREKVRIMPDAALVLSGKTTGGADPLTMGAKGVNRMRAASHKTNAI